MIEINIIRDSKNQDKGSHYGQLHVDLSQEIGKKEMTNEVLLQWTDSYLFKAAAVTSLTLEEDPVMLASTLLVSSLVNQMIAEKSIIAIA